MSVRRVALLLVLAAACGEAAVTTQASGGPPRRTDEDAAPPPAAKAPPCDEAVLGQACANDPTTCELGAHPNVACNERLTCRGPNWELQRDAGACPSDCPDAPDAATSPCAAGAAALVRCAYEDDRTTCGCSRNADAGADAGYVWKCVQADAGCPSLRPPIGAPCVLPLTCDYGGCLFEDRPTMRCLGGYWNLAAPVCASP